MPKYPKNTSGFKMESPIKNKKKKSLVGIDEKSYTKSTPMLNYKKGYYKKAK